MSNEITNSNDPARHVGGPEVTPENGLPVQFQKGSLPHAFQTALKDVWVPNSTLLAMESETLQVVRHILADVLMKPISSNLGHLLSYRIDSVLISTWGIHGMGARIEMPRAVITRTSETELKVDFGTSKEAEEAYKEMDRWNDPNWLHDRIRGRN